MFLFLRIVEMIRHFSVTEIPDEEIEDASVDNADVNSIRVLRNSSARDC